MPGGSCEGKHGWIGDLLIRLTGLERSKNVMTELSENLNHATIEVLIGVELGHGQLTRESLPPLPLPILAARTTD